MAYRDGSGASARWRVVGVGGRVGLGFWKGTVGFVGVGLRRSVRLSSFCDMGLGLRFGLGFWAGTVGFVKLGSCVGRGFWIGKVG